MLIAGDTAAQWVADPGLGYAGPLALRGLEQYGVAANSSPMGETPHRRLPADRDPLTPTEAALERSEAQFAAGQIVSGEEVLRELDESIARMEAKHSGRVRRRVAARR